MTDDHEALGAAIARGARKETNRTKTSQAFQVKLAKNIARMAGEQLKAAPPAPVGSALQEMLGILGHKTWDEFQAAEAARATEAKGD